MNPISSFPSGAALAVAALLVLSAAGPAAAFHHPRPEPVLQCLLDCREARHGCAQACGAGFASCMAGARIEMKQCRDACVAGFEEESPELEACVQTCRVEILVPAREECAPQRQECRPLCHPGPCLEVCRPDGPQLDECRGECAVTLHECATSVRSALHECMMPCREIIDEVERDACAESCVEATRPDAMACHEGFRSCAGECVVEPTTTTTLPSGL